MGLTVNEANNFQSFAYTDPKDRAYVRTIAETTRATSTKSSSTTSTSTTPSRMRTLPPRETKAGPNFVWA